MVFLSLVNFAQSEDLGTTNHHLLRNDLLVSMSPTNKWLNGVTLTIETTLLLHVEHVVTTAAAAEIDICLKMSACHAAKSPKENEEGSRTYRGPCRKMQAMSATFYSHISCYVGDAKLGTTTTTGLKKSVGLFHFNEVSTATSGGIKNEGIFYGFPKFVSLSQTLENSATIKNGGAGDDGGGGIFFPVSLALG